LYLVVQVFNAEFTCTFRQESGELELIVFVDCGKFGYDITIGCALLEHAAGLVDIMFSSK
jgi:hypothetical protein